MGARRENVPLSGNARPQRIGPATGGRTVQARLKTALPRTEAPVRAEVQLGQVHAYLDIVDRWASRQAETLSSAAGEPRS